jgi:hypothetical protein
MFHPDTKQSDGSSTGRNINASDAKKESSGRELFEQRLLTWSQVMLCPRKKVSNSVNNHNVHHMHYLVLCLW